jgi:hypothetical protein
VVKHQKKTHKKSDVAAFYDRGFGVDKTKSIAYQNKQNDDKMMPSLSQKRGYAINSQHQINYQRRHFCDFFEGCNIMVDFGNSVHCYQTDILLPI